MPTQPEIERRYAVGGAKLELRTEDATGKRTLVGYAAVFNSVSEDLGWYREILMPGCFRDALASPDLDTVALFNHNPDLVLARYPSTLRMSEDATGLKCEIDLADTQAGNDVLANIKAGNIYQMSFAFTVKNADYETVDGQDVRKVTSVGRLYDVSPVTYPAYKATSISARAQLRSLDVEKLGHLIFRAENNLELTVEEETFLRNAQNVLNKLLPEEPNPDNSVAVRKIRTRFLKLRQ